MRTAGELGEVLERADRVEVAVEHLLAEHGAAGEQRGEAVGGAVDLELRPVPRRA